MKSVPYTLYIYTLFGNRTDLTAVAIRLLILPAVLYSKFGH